MKTNAIIRIVLFTLAILVLLGILLSGLLFGLYFRNVSSFTESHTTSGDLDMEVLNIDLTGSVSAAAVENISIEWVAGSVIIRPDDTDQITFSESDVSNDKDKMVWKLDGETLKIQYCKDSITFPSFGINVDISKDLVITVPRGWVCNTLEIDAASANIRVHELTINEVDFDGASGTCDFNDCIVDEIDLDTASGDVSFTGTLNTLDCDAASASCDIVVTNIPKRIDIDSASGDLDLTLPENCGFSCNLDSMSGNFTSDFPTTISNGNYTYGDGGCRINVSAMSGDVIIRKGS